jgi:SAM-dependent methyltransferase
MTVSSIKSKILTFLPNWLLMYYKNINYRKKNIPLRDKRFKKLDNKEIFSTIYKDNLWGKHDSSRFYSGPGSNEIEVTKSYIKIISEYFNDDLHALKFLDLGCGDFNIGRELYPNTKSYLGVDVVPELIERNKKIFNAKNLDFLCADIVKDDLPDADCIFLREVLQHLTNSEVTIILDKINIYKYVIITESIPFGKFKSNLDKIKGPESRAYINSGIVLHNAPFYFRENKKKEVLRIKRPGIDFLVTTIYVKN